MIMMSAICTWHGIVTTIKTDKPSVDYIEHIVLGALGVIYLVYNVGFCIMIYLFVSTLVCALCLCLVCVGFPVYQFSC